MIVITENNSPERIETIRALYESAFPPEERMPFARVLEKRDNGTMRLLSVESERGEFLGFANITLCLDVLALNYFAILPEKQGISCDVVGADASVGSVFKNINVK